MKNRTCRLSWLVIVLVLITIQSLAQSVYEPYNFTTIAGNAGYGSADGTGSAARFSLYITFNNGLRVEGSGGVAVDSAGNVYVADEGNNTIRKVTPAGVVTTLAGLAGTYGSADGTGSAARFLGPRGVAVDGEGNVYVADEFNVTIRKVTPAGVVTTLAGLALTPGSADGTGGAARFSPPYGVAVDSAGNVYVAEFDRTIRKVTPMGVVTTLAGVEGGAGVAVDSAGNVYVVDGNTIRKVTPAGVVTVLAAQFVEPLGVAVDSAGNVYVADTYADTIQKITPEGVVTTLAGLSWNPGSADGTGSAARFNLPCSVAVDNAGNVYVGDTGNNTIRKVTPAGAVTTLAGVPSSVGRALYWNDHPVLFNEPWGVAVDSAGNVYVADRLNAVVQKVTPARFVTATLAGFYYPAGVAVDSAANLYVADLGNNTIQKVTPAGVATTFAGLAGKSGSVDGTGSDARFAGPSGVAVDNTGNVYVADSFNNTIRKVTPAGVVTTLAGSYGNADGTGSTAQFNYPQSVAVDSAGNVYVADSNNNAIRKVTLAGVVTTLAGLAPSYGSADGTGSAARFFFPSGVALDSVGNVYVADWGNGTIRKVTAAGVVTTLGGLAGFGGSADGTGSDARFWKPFGVAVDSAGNVYVADQGNNTIRKGFAAPRILSSGPGFGFNGGQFGFNLAGPTGKSVVVEGSTDLLNWLPLRTNTLADGLKFSDPLSGGYSNRFYRAHLP
jgi:hypothetical protein